MFLWIICYITKLKEILKKKKNQIDFHLYKCFFMEKVNPISIYFIFQISRILW
jgi:hypothetical protein